LPASPLELLLVAPDVPEDEDVDPLVDPLLLVEPDEVDDVLPGEGVVASSSPPQWTRTMVKHPKAAASKATRMIQR
jgi:hypothetical protein